MKFTGLLLAGIFAASAPVLAQEAQSAQPDANLMALYECKITEGQSVGATVQVLIIQGIASSTFSFEIPVLQFRVFDAQENLVFMESDLATQSFVPGVANITAVWSTLSSTFVEVTTPSDNPFIEPAVTRSFSFAGGSGACVVPEEIQSTEGQTQPEATAPETPAQPQTPDEDQAPAATEAAPVQGR